MSDLWPGLSKPVQLPPAIFTEELPLNETYVCTTCQDTAAIEELEDEVICMRCGTQLDIPLDWSAEYRFYNSETAGADPTRCGFPINPLMPESSLGTIILGGTTGSNAIRRIRRYHMWNQMPYREHTLWKIFESLQIRASNAGIGSAIVDEAKELFAQLTASQICRGTGQRDAALAACLWEALRRHDAARLPKDLAEIFCIPLKQVTKGIKQFQHILAMRQNDRRTDTYTVPKQEEAPPNVQAAPQQGMTIALQRKAQQQAALKRTTSYADFVEPFLSKLSIAPRIFGTMVEIVHRVCATTEEMNIVPENTPPSLTASVIAFVAEDLGVPLELTEIARVCGISVVTIQKCLKRMHICKEKLLKK